MCHPISFAQARSRGRDLSAPQTPVKRLDAAPRRGEEYTSSVSSGAVYLVGAGPGAPGLVTVRGAELIASADVILHDDLVPRQLLALAPAGAEIVYVGKRGHFPAEKSRKQSEIDEALVAYAKTGKRVVRLKGGDPYLFGRGSEEAEALARAGLPFEVVPGVCSPLAAAAYAGMSLTHRDLASSVTFVSATQRDGAPFDFGELTQIRGTICVLMGVKHLDDVARDLVAKAGRDASTPAAIIESATSPRQRVVSSTLADIADRARAENVGAPAILIVGDVVSLRARQGGRLRWFDARPLFGKRVLVPRAREQAAEAISLLEARGAEAIAIPTISIRPVGGEELARAIQRLRTYDVVAFTSANAVDRFFGALAEQRLDARAFGEARVASIGAATTRALDAARVRPDVVPANADGASLGRAILDALGSKVGARVLFPRAAAARDALFDVLRPAGVEVDGVTIYETTKPDEAGRGALVGAFTEGIEAVLATSPSTIEHLVDALGERAKELLRGVAIACIGETTAEATRALGLEVALISSPSTVAVLVDALAARYASSYVSTP